MIATTFVRHLVIYSVVGAGLLVGCVGNRPGGATESFNKVREGEFWWGKTTFLALNADAIAARSPALCCQEANDKSLTQEYRRWAAALLFGAWVKPGFTADDLRRVLASPAWLDDCSIAGASSGGGGYPFLYHVGSHFCLQLFPKDDEPVGWTIYFTLVAATGNGGAEYRNSGATPIAVEEAAAFLKGGRLDRRLRIAEFTMFYPLPGCEAGGYVEEAHGPKGVGIKVRPAGNFGDE